MPRPIFAPDLRFPHIYVHLPFCETICHYCDFYVARAREADHAALFAAITTQLRLNEPWLDDELATVYFGGGTPSEAPTELLAGFLRQLGPRVSARTEVTIEANPTSIDAEKAIAWHEAGVNRVSVGTQSLRDAHLKRLGRVHDGPEALASVATVAARIENVSADLIYGVPGMQEADAANDAAALIAAGARHLSAYTLTLSPSHFLHAKLPDDETTLRQSLAIRDRLHALGLEPYEASNYARPGYESRHNQAYWASRPYLALGPSAHGYDGKNLRWRNIADWKTYVAKLADSVEEPILDWEVLGLPERRNELLITRLRSRRGLNLKDSKDLLGEAWLREKRNIFQQLEEAGLGTWEGDAWIPSFQGLMLADEVALKLA